MITTLNLATLCFLAAAPSALSNKVAAQVDNSTPLSLVIPAYVYPRDWDNGGEISQAYLTLKDSALRYPEVTHVIVLNPNNGEGSTSAPDDDWQPAIDLLSGVANVKLIGYVSTGYGDLEREEVVREQILGYHDNDWKVEGIFFDETNGVSETEQSTVLEMYTGYMELTRSLWNSESSVFNFGSTNMIDGTPYNMDWLTTCDINIMLENKGFDKLDDFTPNEAQLQLPREKSNLMLRDTEVEEIDLEKAWLNHFGSVYFVDRPDDYNDIYGPEDWDEMMLKVAYFVAPLR